MTPTPPVFDKEQFNAYTTRHITMLLLYGLFVLVIGILVAAFLPLNSNDKIIALVSPIITGIYGLASGAVGYWIAKQRLPIPDPSTTTTTLHQVTGPSPQVVPSGSELVPAPTPPAAIVTAPLDPPK